MGSLSRVEKERRRVIGMEMLEAWSLKNKTYKWKEQAACKGVQKIFFNTQGYSALRMERAKEICGACPVKKECLTYALDNLFVSGIWGGKTPNERLVILNLKRWPVSL